MFKYFFLILSIFSLTGCSNPTQTETSNASATETVTPVAKILYVDVREDDEWAAGHIEGALHVKLGDIEAGRFNTIPKDTPVALYCRSGRRSAIAHGILKNAGYTNVTDAGGMEQVRDVTIVR